MLLKDELNQVGGGGAACESNQSQKELKTYHIYKGSNFETMNLGGP